MRMMTGLLENKIVYFGSIFRNNDVKWRDINDFVEFVKNIFY